jgi:AAA15 family ATPase/GTPase
MIRQLHISNYKSLNDLTVDVGRFNVIIGENGSGKSNLLEAIAFVAAASADKLDNEFLASRGIRVTEPQLMCSVFDKENLQKPIDISINFENGAIADDFKLINDNQPYSKWTRFNSTLSEVAKSSWILTKQNRALQKLTPQDNEAFKAINLQQDELNKELLDFLTNVFKGNEDIAKIYLEHLECIGDDVDKLKNFLIFSPENTALRNFGKEGQIEPLGINGEGLLKILKVIQNESPEQRQEIHDCLQLFDWYDEIDIPKELSASENKVTITDRYLSIALDQISVNEGFLFVLFYIALMVSDYTPKIFAIDNIDTSLNPKLCSNLIKELVRLAKKYDKQVFVTTHNPAILDGIDLDDDEQRLLVASRNKQGHTGFKRIGLTDKPHSSSNEALKLSEAFLRGYLGGLPKGL